MSKLEDALLEIIAEIQERKVQRRVEPALCTRMEVIVEMNEALNRLYTSKRIEVGHTINDRWIKVVKD